MMARLTGIALLALLVVPTPARAAAPPPPSVAHGDAAFRAGNGAAAEAGWKADLAAHPGDPTAHLRLGLLYLAQHRDLEALRMLDELAPTQVTVRALVRVHTRLGDLGAFVNSASDDAMRNPNDPDVQWRAANVLQAMRREAEALALYSRAVALRKGRCDELLGRAGDLLALRRIDEAVADVNRCLTHEPASYEAWVALGSAELARNAFDAAERAIDRALGLRPDGVDGLIDRAVLEDARGASVAAFADNHAAIAIDPMRSEPYANLGFDFLDRHEDADAESVLRDGLRADPDDGRLHYLLGEALRRQGAPLAAVRREYLAALASDEDTVVRAARDALRALATNARLMDDQG
jgi:tetratricopeptide (TPR) repeat protein